eukprot:CAMPEP_0182881872 /NCGR_PEP_ID=MMETSP0034_2-20130328/17430_1 /TAXON_ID=156128 /ORGANISM="Nephroselmis pyriformis, Strain CCMP717" /LENGTH=367 /DNA_ID=CAMNT_0025014921 /DNA_START=100 /DNA_END=1200 /DNA_ORIENTATION=-
MSSGLAKSGASQPPLQATHAQGGGVASASHDFSGGAGAGAIGTAPPAHGPGEGQHDLAEFVPPPRASDAEVLAQKCGDATVRSLGGDLKKPTPFQNLKRNSYVHRTHKVLERDEVPLCTCTPPSQGGKGCDEDCLNILTYNECSAQHCPCGSECENQRFVRHRYAKSKLRKTGDKGWGLFATAPIPEGSFVMEYIGEVVSPQEAARRVDSYEAAGEAHTYMMNLSSTEVIDASRKGCSARFINHSCAPNCATQKWTVQGEWRVGLFSERDIQQGEELTYDYNFEWYGGKQVKCLCGAATCSGFLGSKSARFKERMAITKTFTGHVRWEYDADEDDEFPIDDLNVYDSDPDVPAPRKVYRASDGPYTV